MKQILFNTEMVRAILDGRKTTTRRICKFNWDNGSDDKKFVRLFENGKKGLFDDSGQSFHSTAPCVKGDILYVRETFAITAYTGTESTPDYYFKTDGTILPSGVKWHPSIHMPKEAARIFLRVTDVKVERLQEITEDGAKAEGTDSDVQIAGGYVNNGYYRSRFACHLWNSTIKKNDVAKYGWDANPLVWVISFERCENPNRLCDHSTLLSGY